MDAFEFKQRTKRFAVQVIEFVGGFPPGRATDVIGRQLIRAGTSVGANYRAACRAQSPGAMVAKLAIVEEEADECLYWVELALDAGLVSPERAAPLRREASEILAMVVASKKTLRSRTAAGSGRQSSIVNRQSQATR